MSKLMYYGRKRYPDPPYYKHCCCCCCEIPDHRVVPTVGTSLVSYSQTLHVVSVLYGDFNMCFLYDSSYATLVVFCLII